MTKRPAELARELLLLDEDQLEELEILECPDDETSHDEAFHARAARTFAAAFNKARDALTAAYGPPATTGQHDDDDVPLNGVFRFATWNVGTRKLYVAAAHEDRELPYLLIMGTIAEEIG